MIIRIRKEFTFEASHVLPKHPGKCARLHGHSWKLGVEVQGPVDPETGFVVDFGVLSECVKAHVIQRVDHYHLGYGDATIHVDFPGSPEPKLRSYNCGLGSDFYPTSENLVMAFARILGPLVRELGNPDARLFAVDLNETCTSAARWERSVAGHLGEAL